MSNRLPHIGGRLTTSRGRHRSWTGATKMRTGATMFLHPHALKHMRGDDETDEATTKPDRNIQAVSAGSAKKPANGTPGDGTSRGGFMRDFVHHAGLASDGSRPPGSGPIRLSLNHAPER